MPPQNATRPREETERGKGSYSTTTSAAAAAAYPPPPRRLPPAKEELGEDADDDSIGMCLDGVTDEGEEEVSSSSPSTSPSNLPLALVPSIPPFKSPSFSMSTSCYQSSSFSLADLPFPSLLPSFSPRLRPLLIPRQGHVPLRLDKYQSILQNSKKLLQGKRTYIRTKPRKPSHLARNSDKFKVPKTPPKDPEKFQTPSTLIHTDRNLEKFKIPSTLLDVAEKFQMSSIMFNTEDYSRNIEDKEPLSALAATYSKESNVIRAKIQHLGGKYDLFRRVRGDGNCFYRSFVFSYVERIVETQDIGEATRVLTCLEKFKHDYSIIFGEDEGDFSELGLEFKELMEETIKGKKTGIIFSVEELLEKFLDDFHTNVVLKFIRVITSIEICKWEKFYRPFLDDEMIYATMNEYCEEEVSTMGKEASHLHIQALVNALCVPLRVEYLYSSTQSGKLETNHHDFDPVSYSQDAMASPPPSDNGSLTTEKGKATAPMEEERLRVTLLYRPGHYDILYPK